jgi:hypothetical protein
MQRSMRPDTAFHIICERDVGLFSLIQQVISHIPWAFREGRCPIVHFGSNCAYWTPSGYAERDTVWEYYFQPLIEGFGVEVIPAQFLKEIKAKYPSGPYKSLDERSIASTDFGSHPSLRGKTIDIPYEWLDPPKQLRVRTRKIFEEFIRPRDYLALKVDAFFGDKMAGHPVLGVHARGTDAVDDQSKGFRVGSLRLDRYQSFIDRFLKAHQDAKVFVATDEETVLEHLVSAYGEKVLSYPSIRRKGGVAAGRGPMGNRMPGYVTESRDIAARNGEEAVVEFLLLSRCGSLIHNGSSLARTVLLATPNMRHVNVHFRSAPLLTRARTAVDGARSNLLYRWKSDAPGY